MVIETVLLSLASAIVGGLVVAVVNHRLTRSRELEAKRRDIALLHLVGAWQALDAASDKAGIRRADLKKAEEAIRTIVLFSSDKIIDLAETAVKTFETKGNADWTPILKNLRDGIRSSMGIDGKSRHFWFAIEPSENNREAP